MKKYKPAISNEAVLKATGRDWKEWFSILDKEGAREMAHRETAKMLKEKGYIKNGWWRQTVTVEYEKTHGKRVLGQTADAGFQVGVQKTFPIAPDRAWELVTKPKGRKLWLGKVSRIRFEKGQTYKTEDGTSGVLRSVTEGKHIRLTRQLNDQDRHTTLQIHIIASGDKTSIRFHHEKLSGEEERAEMKAHWKKVLDELEALLK